MTRPEILDTAKKCVCGDREQDYGTPENNFSTIAALWNAYEDARYIAAEKAGKLRVIRDVTVGSVQTIDTTYDLTATDVAVMMTLVKIARIASGHGKADNWVDGCGYLACGGEIESAQNKPTTDNPNRPTQAEYEELFATVEPVKGKYEGLSNTSLYLLIHNHINTKSCVDCMARCPLSASKNGSGLSCETFSKQHPEEFRKIAIDWLNKQDGLEGKA